jgi:ketosteroid isomerase-like protein
VDAWELAAREQVRDTVAAYTHAGDRSRLEALAACFTSDGVLEVKGMPQARGRSEIIAMLSSAISTSEPARGFVRHFIANLHFQAVTRERIETAAYFAVFTAHGPDHWGRYRDVFVPVGEQWLLAHRRVTVDARARGSYLS